MIEEMPMDIIDEMRKMVTPDIYKSIENEIKECGGRNFQIQDD